MHATSQEHPLHANMIGCADEILPRRPLSVRNAVSLGDLAEAAGALQTTFRQFRKTPPAAYRKNKAGAGPIAAGPPQPWPRIFVDSDASAALRPITTLASRGCLRFLRGCIRCVQKPGQSQLARHSGAAGRGNASAAPPRPRS